MQPRRPSAPFLSLLLLVLISAFFTAGSASPHGHFSIDDHVRRINTNKRKLDQIIVSITEDCGNSAGVDLCGPCLADILKILGQEEASSIAEDDNTSSQQASALDQNTRGNEEIAAAQSKCQSIISKTKALVKQNAALKQQLKAAGQKIIEQEHTIIQQGQDILSQKNSLDICSDLRKEC